MVTAVRRESGCERGGRAAILCKVSFDHKKPLRLVKTFCLFANNPYRYQTRRATIGLLSPWALPDVRGRGGGFWRVPPKARRAEASPSGTRIKPGYPVGCWNNIP